MHRHIRTLMRVLMVWVRSGELIVVGVVRVESGSLVMMVVVVVDMWVLGTCWVATTRGEEAGSAREEIDVAEFF